MVSGFQGSSIEGFWGSAKTSAAVPDPEIETQLSETTMIMRMMIMISKKEEEEQQQQQ
jgi:hypothetical protein